MRPPVGGPRRRPWRRAAAWLALLTPFFYLSYGLANHLAAARAEVPSVVFAWERQIPFWAWTIFPYWGLNACYGLSLFLARGRRELDRHAARLLTAQCIAVACFIAFPLRFSFGQPEVDGAAGWLFAALRGFDQPYNQAPSLHVALVVILWDWYRRRLSGRLARGLLHAGSLLIAVSVLTTWQHHFIDIPTGALLGALCVWAWPLEPRLSMAAAWRRGAGARRQRLAACYAAGALACTLAAASGARAGWPWALLLGWPAVSLVLVALSYAGLGERGFQTGRRGRLPWAAGWLLAPYQLAARLNARLWTRGLPPARELLPGLWLGSLERLGSAAASPGGAGLPAGIRPRTLLSLCAELPAPRARAADAPAICCLPWLDLVPASPSRLRAAAAHIEQARRRGEPLVVACALGFSRSVAAVACWLVRSGQALEVDDALRQIRQVHPQARLNADWIEALRRACEPVPPPGPGRPPAAGAASAGAPACAPPAGPRLPIGAAS